MKKTLVLWLGTLLVINVGCNKRGQRSALERAATNNRAVIMETPQRPAKVTKEMAVATAKADYIRRKGSLKGFDFDVSEESGGWQISFHPQVRNGTIDGGGSVYLIDKETGKILDLKLHQ